MQCTNPSLLRLMFQFLSSFPVVGLPRVVGYDKTEFQPLLPTSDVALFVFSPWVGIALQAVRSFSEATVSAYVCRFHVSWEEVGSGSSYITILGHLSWISSLISQRHTNIFKRNSYRNTDCSHSQVKGTWCRELTNNEDLLYAWVRMQHFYTQSPF